ncbi:MAG: ABC transporter permease [Acidobacteria bacterium]|nr:ABC transporter permease [Acidobacteriota bacterium]
MRRSSHGALGRVRALMAKDAAELVRHPGTLVPAFVMVIGALVPAFLIAVIAPALSGESFDDGEFADAARRAAAVIPELAALEGRARVQALLFHQFLLLVLLVPVVGSMSLAAHAVISEKQSHALEPLLATPITTGELLAAKALTPFLVSLALLAFAMILYVGGIALTAAPGVWRALLGPRTVLLGLVGGPLISLTGLQMAVIVSSRVNDPRSAQQLGGLVVMPITIAFVAQMVGQYVWGVQPLLVALVVLAVVNVGLLWLGVRVFQRETILMRWK